MALYVIIVVFSVFSLNNHNCFFVPCNNVRWYQCAIFVSYFTSASRNSFPSPILSVDHMLAAGEFIGIGAHGMAFFSTHDTDHTKFVMKQTTIRTSDPLREFHNLEDLHAAGVSSVVQARAHFNGHCVESLGGPVTFVVSLYRSIHSLFEREEDTGAAWCQFFV